MDYVFVLEDEEIHQKAISKALKTINPQLKTKFFKDIEDFYKWLKGAMSSTGRVLEVELDDSSPERICLFISKAELIGPANLSILSKTRELLTHRGLCSPENPLGFVLTAFDDPDFKFEQYKNPILLNLIFKPFDEIILTQHLSSALAGFSKPEESTLSSQKTSATAEMLKAIEIMAVSDVGFTSKSKKAYPQGNLAKYYSNVFASGDTRSIHARLNRLTEVANGAFELDYQYFGSENSQIGNIRKAVRDKAKGKPMERGPEGGTPVSSPVFAIIEHRETEFNLIASTLKRRFGGAQIFRFNSRKEFEEDLDFAGRAVKVLSADSVSVEISKDYKVKKAIPSELTIFGKPAQDFDFSLVMDKASQNQLGIFMIGAAKEHLAIVKMNNAYGVVKFVKNGNQMAMVNPSPNEGSDFLKTRRQTPNEIHYVIFCADVDLNSLDSWIQLSQLLNNESKVKPVCYLLTSKNHNDEDKRKLESFFDDIFYAPLDRAYFLLKIIYSRYALKVLEDKLYITEKNVTEKVYAASSVHIDEVSEAGIGFKYPGKMEKGSFREFVLGKSNDPSTPVLTGICYSSEPSGDKGEDSSVYFVFFGVRDHELKFIRLWIRENYVHAKEKGG